MSESKFIHTLSGSKNIFALEQNTIVFSFVKMLRFYWDTPYIARKVLMRAIELSKNLLFIIFEPLCQTFWASHYVKFWPFSRCPFAKYGHVT